MRYQATARRTKNLVKLGLKYSVKYSVDFCSRKVDFKLFSGHLSCSFLQFIIIYFYLWVWFYHLHLFSFWLFIEKRPFENGRALKSYTLTSAAFGRGLFYDNGHPDQHSRDFCLSAWVFKPVFLQMS